MHWNEGAPELPSHLLDGVGPGDFWAVGQHMVGLLDRYANLRPTERVLDIGCGLGRIAWPLSQRLDDRSTYDGFDTLSPYIDVCRTALGLEGRRFRFYFFDLRSTMYNPEGSVVSETFYFPWRASAFTLAIATSLFTHLVPEAATHYLREISRTLERGGRLYATFFVLDEASKKLVARRTTDPPFSVPFEHGLYADAEHPEAAVAFDADWLLEQFLEAGFTIREYVPGSWRRIRGAQYQDIVVAVKD
jgi:SAM-dependent methyltransferase